jgi:signal transduction histidine kinase
MQNLDAQVNDVLRLLRVMALLMLATLIPSSIALLSIAPSSDTWGWWAFFGLALLPITFVFIPGLKQRLGTRHLPVALFLFISALAVELTLQSSGALAQEFLIRTGRDPQMTFGSWRGEVFLFLLVPTILAAWAYGRRGAMRAAAWGTVLHIAGGLWLWYVDGKFPEGYWQTMPVRLFLLFAVPRLVAYLADRQREQHDALQAAHQQLQRQTALSEELAVSRERNRLARDLHDTLAHSLAGLVVELEAVSTLFELDSEATRAELSKAQALARAGLDEARAAIRDLRESPAQDLGLGQALRQLVNDFGERTGLQVHAEFVISGPGLSLPPETSAGLYRIVQEALANVERHAYATAVTLRLETSDDRLNLTIIDDGAGFETGDILENRFGLIGMQERAELMGATLHVKGEPGRGTQVRLELYFGPDLRKHGA